MSFFSFVKRNTLTHIIDIRDTYLTSSIFKFEKDKKPELLFVQDFKIKNNHSGNHDSHMRGMFNAVEEAVLDGKLSISKLKTSGKISNIHFFFGPLWSVSQSKTVKITKDKSFEVTQKLIDGMYASQAEEFEKNAKENNLSLLEQNIVQSKLSGYEMHEMFGKKTNELELEIFTSLLSDTIKDHLKLYENHSTVKFNTSILSSYTFFRNLYADKNDFVYIEIGELITEICLVRNDCIASLVSIPTGKNEILDSLSKKLKVSINLLTSKLSASSHGGNILSNDERLIVSDTILEFMKKVDEGVRQISADVDLPIHIFLIRNDEISTQIIREIEKVKMNNTISLFSQNSKLNVIEDRVLNTFVVSGKSVRNQPYVKMEAVFLNNLKK